MNSLTRPEGGGPGLPGAWASSSNAPSAAWLPSLGHLTITVGLAVLLLGWAAEIKLGSQLGRPLTRDQPAMPTGLFILAAGLTLVAFGALERLAHRRSLAWWQRIALSGLAGLSVALGLLIVSRLVPRWREASSVALLLYLILLTGAGAWMAAGWVRPQAPPVWRTLLHPVWPSLLLGAALVAAGLALDIGRPDEGPQPGSLLKEATRYMTATYPAEFTDSTLPQIATWEGLAVLLAPPPSDLAIPLRIPPLARFSATAGFPPSLFLASQAGVSFRVEWQAGGRSELLYEYTLIPENVNRSGERIPVEVDLQHLAHQEGRLVLRTTSVGFPPGPVVEAAWLNPRLDARSPLPAAEALARDGLLSLAIGLLIALWTRIRDE